MPFLAALLAMLLPLSAASSPLSGARQLTFEGVRAGEGYFDADGGRMIFQSEREPGNPFYQMYMLDLETGDVERLSPGIGKTTCGWLHPDGQRALFASTQFDPEARTKMQAELDFRASGKSRRYAWDYDPTYDIVETDLSTGAYKKLTDALGYDAEGSYSPDGEQIVFASNRHAYAAELTPEYAEKLKRDPAYFMDLYVMNADGGDVRRLTRAHGYDGGPFWSADGKQITWRRFSEDGARAEIFVMDVDNGRERQLTDLGVMSWAPYFHPSGDYLIFATNLQGFANFELYLVDAAGAKQPVRVTDRAGFDGLATFTPDGKTLSWTSNATGDKKSQIFVGAWDHEAALALLAAAPARASAASATPIDGTEAKIAAADIRRHVEALTAPEMAGRLTGHEGEKLATAYVADAFAAIGLAPAGDDGMFQNFDFTAGVEVGPASTLSVSVDGEPKALTLDSQWRPLAFSKAGALKKTNVAFAGYGLVAPAEGDTPAFDSYGEVDVTGKLALIWRGMPIDLSVERRTALSRYADLRYKASVAKSRGAVGVIFAPPPRDGFADKLPRLAYEAAAGSALPAFAVDRAAAARMLSILGDDLTEMTKTIEAGKTAGRDLIGVAASANIDLSFDRRKGRNVVARLELDGKTAGGPPPVVIGAHVDHLGRGQTSSSRASAEQANAIHPGADDNASGVAALIEIAQHLADAKKRGKLKGARDIVFAAWSGEELGLLGSTHYVEKALEAAGAEDLKGVVAAYVNMDMIGRLEDKLVVAGMGSSKIWAREVERRNAVVGLPINASKDAYLPTDSTAFYLKGAPILSMFTGAHTDYHTPEDTAEKLNYEGARDIARFAGLVVRSLARAEAAPDYIAVARPKTQGSRRMGNVFLGTIPDYSGKKAKGVAISGVVKSGPAEAAGLKGGDVIVGLAGQELENIYDFVRALNGLKPGVEIDIAVQREGEKVDLKITPAARN